MASDLTWQFMGTALRINKHNFIHTCVNSPELFSVIDLRKIANSYKKNKA